MMKYVDKSIADDEQFDGIDANSPYYLQRLDEDIQHSVYDGLNHQELYLIGQVIKFTLTGHINWTTYF